jgi:hypothetical protein
MTTAVRFLCMFLLSPRAIKFVSRHIVQDLYPLSNLWNIEENLQDFLFRFLKRVCNIWTSVILGKKYLAASYVSCVTIKLPEATPLSVKQLHAKCVILNFNAYLILTLRGICCTNRQAHIGSMFLLNRVSYLRHYKASHARIQLSSSYRSENLKLHRPLYYYHLISNAVQPMYNNQFINC